MLRYSTPLCRLRVNRKPGFYSWSLWFDIVWIYLLKQQQIDVRQNQNSAGLDLSGRTCFQQNMHLLSRYTEDERHQMAFSFIFINFILQAEIQTLCPSTCRSSPCACANLFSTFLSTSDWPTCLSIHDVSPDAKWVALSLLARCGCTTWTHVAMIANFTSQSACLCRRTLNRHRMTCPFCLYYFLA